MKSNSSIYADCDTCPQCDEDDEKLWYLECCGLVMCEDCKEKHDVKYHLEENETA